MNIIWSTSDIAKSRFCLLFLMLGLLFSRGDLLVLGFVALLIAYFLPDFFFYTFSRIPLFSMRISYMYSLLASSQPISSLTSQAPGIKSVILLAHGLDGSVKDFSVIPPPNASIKVYRIKGMRIPLVLDFFSKSCQARPQQCVCAMHLGKIP